MSGNCYDRCEFYVCDECGSFDCSNATERNYNDPRCNSCDSRKLSPNDLFNDYVFRKKKPIRLVSKDGNLIIKGYMFDREKLSKATKRKKKFLIKKYGSSKTEYNRNIKLEEILNLKRY